MASNTQTSGRRVLIAGAGIIGLAIAEALLERGFAVTLCDPNVPGSQTSSGNAGGIGVTEVVPHMMPGMLWHLPAWLFDPLGPLSIRWRELPALLPWFRQALKATKPDAVRAIATAQAALLSTTYTDLEAMLGRIGLSHVLHRRGALTVYRSEQSFLADYAGWQLRRDLQVAWEKVIASDIRELEPALGEHFQVGVKTPDWGHVDDPYEIAERLSRVCSQRGAKFLSHRVVSCEPCATGGGQVRLDDGSRIPFDRFVLAAGVWSTALAAQLGHRVPLVAERGYNVTLADAQVDINNEVIFGDEKFVVTPLKPGLRVGGAAEFAGIDAPANYERSEAMARLASRVIPKLNLTPRSQWMGQRPTLPDTIPVISRSPAYAQVFFAFGHSHLGLTQAATTGRLVAQMIMGQTFDIDLKPFRIDRF